jgi:hypothetical protein
MRYIVEFGRASTGLVPVFDTLVRLDTLGAVAQPAIVEIPGTGAYYFDFNFPDGVTYDIYFSVDSRSNDLGAVGEDSRYRTGVLSPNDAFLDKKITDVGAQDQAAVLAAIVAARDSIKGASNRDITQIGVKTDQLPNDPASQATTGTKVDQVQAAIQASVTSARQTIMGVDNRTVTEVYEKVKDFPADVAGQAATDAAILAARVEIDARIDASQAALQGNLGGQISAAQAELDARIDASVVDIKGSDDKSITDVDQKTRNLPADPASGAAVIAQVTAARDSVNGTVMTATDLVTGPDGRNNTQIYDKVQNIPNTAIAEASAVDAIPGQVRDLLGGAGFDSGTDTLHQIRAQQDAQAAVLTSHTSLLARVLGMLHENSVLDQTVYDSENNLTAGRLRIYDTAAHASAAHAAGEGDDSTPGKIAEYAIAGTYVGALLESYAVTRILP